MQMNDEAPHGYRTQSEDTTYEVERRLIEAYRAMTPLEKARRVVDDCVCLEVLTVAGLRVRYPSDSEAALRRRLAVLRFGEELANAAFGAEQDVL